MDSSTPATPISRQANPCVIRTKLEEEDPNVSHIHIAMPTPPSTGKSPILLLHHPNPISLQDLLLLSPSPCRKSRTRPQPVVVEEPIESTMDGRRKSKNRNGTGASPKTTRRARRRVEKENSREERQLVAFDQINDVGGMRKRRQSGRTKVSHKERMASMASLPPSSPPCAPICDTVVEDDKSHGNEGGLWELISDLVMWKDVGKSSLWFGLGTMFILSSSFSKDVISFSMISAVSHLALLILGLSFFYDSLPQRQQQLKKGTNFKLTEDDILQVARLILPMSNAALSAGQKIFCGEPLMTLKVAPVLFFAAKYGQLITPWRLLTAGFFLSFALPKLYTCYCDFIQKKAEEMRSHLLEAWKSCPRKKFVAAAAVTVLWNLFSLKMRIFAAFITVVVLRCHHQQYTGDESAEMESKEEELQQAIMAAE